MVITLDIDRWVLDHRNKLHDLLWYSGVVVNVVHGQEVKSLKENFVRNFILLILHDSNLHERYIQG